jgi:hypothetical protein
MRSKLSDKQRIERGISARGQPATGTGTVRTKAMAMEIEKRRRDEAAAGDARHAGAVGGRGAMRVGAGVQARACERAESL